MSMTKEEAFKQYEEWRNLGFGHSTMPSSEVLVMAMNSLRPITREQVEKVWKGEWIGIPNMGVYDIACSKCGYSTGIRFWSSDFCPNCGAPLTDEAVEIIMERLEETT